MSARMENARMRQLRKNYGFTLVEILMVVALLGIFSIAVVQVFFTIVSQQTKTAAIEEVKQSGDYAFSVMETMIRNAKVVNLPSCNTFLNQKSIEIENPDKGITTFDCSGSKISSQSADYSVLDLTGPNVVVSSCNISYVCPTPAAGGTAGRYVYFSYVVEPANVTPGDPIAGSTQSYQGTVTIRNLAE